MKCFEMLIIINDLIRIGLTVNMKCFEIFKAKDLFTMTDKLTVNMKCFEILEMIL